MANLEVFERGLALALCEDERTIEGKHNNDEHYLAARVDEGLHGGEG